MLEAIDKMFQFNQNRRIDMFKDISVPGLVLKYMFQDLPDYFTVPNEKNKDLYDLYKNNIIGAKNTGQHIRHHSNDSEKLIGMKRLPVDGSCRHQHRLRIPGMYLARTSMLDDQKR